MEEEEYLEFYFQHEYNGEMFPLINDGENVKVNNSNKMSYVLLKIDFMIKNFIYDQIIAIRKGLFKIIPEETFKNFTAKEFEYFLCGETEINISDWKTHSVYSGLYNEDHYIIKWFWSYIESLDQKSLRIIFQFVTGMSRLPAGGFNSLNKNRGERQFFNIRSINYYPETPYPKAYTCFNRLHLPSYPNMETLKKNMNFILEQNEIYGFGLED